MKTPQYTYQYDNLTVTYEIEGDVDGNHAVIKNISADNIDYIDKNTMIDIKFCCLCDFNDKAMDFYMKTGKMIWEN